MNDSFQDKIRVACKVDEKWQDKSRELVRLREGVKKMRANAYKRTGYYTSKISYAFQKTKRCRP